MRKIKRRKPRPKKGATGTREWATHSVNIQTGCEHDCRYCYAREMAERFKRVEKGRWNKEIISHMAVGKKRKKMDGVVMFPTTHDITENNLPEVIIVLKDLLMEGNKVLIVSKPHFECVHALCRFLCGHEDQILFRFTIGSDDDEVLSYWEPGAPNFLERRTCLIHAKAAGFQTSVSIEPLLDGLNIVPLVKKLIPHVTDSIWIGKMNKVSTRVVVETESDIVWVQRVEAGQTDDQLRKIYNEFKDNPLVKWKESVKKVVGIKLSEEPGLDK